MKLFMAEEKDYPLIKKLYKKSFPLNERAPFFVIKKKTINGKSEMLIAKENDQFIGFFYIVRNEDLVYLFYFAVNDTQRGKGYGSKMLQLLKEKYPGKNIFLAREQLDTNSDNYDERVKRRNFYIRNGFKDTELLIKEASVIYDVMALNDDISAKDYEILIDNWSGKFIKTFIDMKIIEKK